MQKSRRLSGRLHELARGTGGQRNGPGPGTLPFWSRSRDDLSAHGAFALPVALIVAGWPGLV
jgi:hypothetical protein